MVLFNCPTCSTTLEDQEMLKHLSTTRHKTLVHVSSQQTLECDKCQDSNIHQLSIIRYGGSDITMLCQTCLNKEPEKSSTQYTSQNGMILKYFEKYLKFANLECQFCGNESHLSIDEKNSNFVACYKCIKEKNLESTHTFIKETADNFLYLFLGIKESIKQGNKTSRKRQIGRGKKGKKSGLKGSRLPRPGKPSQTTKVIVPTDVNDSLKSFQSLSKSDLDKVRPDDEKQNKIQNRPPPSKSNNKAISSTIPSISSQSPSNRNDSRSKSKKSNNGKGPTQNKNSNETIGKDSLKKNSDKKNGKPTSSNKSLDSKAISNARNDSTSKNDKSIHHNQSNDISKGLKELKIDNGESKKLNSKNLKKPEKGNNGKDQKELNLTKDSKNSNASKKSDKKKDNNKTVQKLDSKKQQNEKDQPSKHKIEVQNESEVPEKKEQQEVEEYEHIPRYQSKQPKLSYESMEEYFTEMCSHLYLEQKLDTEPIKQFYPDWTTSRNIFKLSIPNTKEIQNLVPEKLKSVGKKPFSINQGVFITRSGDINNVYTAFIRDLEPIFASKRSKDIVEYDLLLELFKWNDIQSFPYGSANLQITPCSVPISRILLAMSRIENKSFISMLLGKTTIKQINFNNRLNFTTGRLNQSQKVSIQHVLNNSITVLQGPPGTGKTSTIHEIILQLIRNFHSFPILVVAASNVAIDNIAEKLKENKDLRILRITSMEKEKEYNEKHPLSDICLHRKVYDQLPLNMKETVQKLRKGEKISQTSYKKYLTTMITITDRLVAQAQIILTTTVTAGGNQLKNVSKIPIVIMDEATQSNEASSLIPLSIPGVDKFLFVGDQRQLSSFSDVPYLEQSLFERVIKNETYKTPHMLDTQYRMHPKISEFPIKEFYNGELKDGVTPSDKYLSGVDPLTFIDYGSKHRESRVPNKMNGLTYQNIGEVELILRVIKQLKFDNNIPNNKISIITPYSAQRDLLANGIKLDLDLNPSRLEIAEEVDEDSLTSKRPATVKTIVDIMISSIDAYQGREKEIIIFSCVRSNSHNNIGFVKDPRRLNVALTRAKNSLILVGNKKCLKNGNELWERLISHIEKGGDVVKDRDYFKEVIQESV
ncbi:hypothetical protein WICMUC_001233 [Wickerhamomyces mucosus]|uniref:AAA+ ATPase domain-containing protein n=1 Tax=Wickerhamomyces mucosus TaxID=1378264 RepID=A0A9P8TGT4_9ASCO|nr:hypothetical protein WICMUC_001233 [Wickerhamomyces mucosus]